MPPPPAAVGTGNTGTVEQKCPQDSAAGGSADDLQRRLAALSGGGGGAQPPPAVAAKPAWMTATKPVVETADVVTPLPPVVPAETVAVAVAAAAAVREKYRALFNFDARTADELSFKIGDEIYLVDPAQAGEGSIAGRDGWIRGTTEDGSRAGLFPGNYVEKAEA